MSVEIVPIIGTVLLFYRYYSAAPVLTPAYTPAQLHEFHLNLGEKLGLTGKIRIAKEGFKITVAGEKGMVASYVRQLSVHESLSGMQLGEGDLEDDTVRRFFKPTPGKVVDVYVCVCMSISGCGWYSCTACGVYVV